MRGSLSVLFVCPSVRPFIRLSVRSSVCPYVQMIYFFIAIWYRPSLGNDSDQMIVTLHYIYVNTSYLSLCTQSADPNHFRVKASMYQIILRPEYISCCTCMNGPKYKTGAQGCQRQHFREFEWWKDTFSLLFNCVWFINPSRPGSVDISAQSFLNYNCS